MNLLNLVEIVQTHPSTVDPPCWQRQMEKLQLQEWEMIAKQRDFCTFYLKNSATAVLAFLSQNLIHIIFGGCYFSRLEGLAASTGVWTLGRMIPSGSLPNNQELVFTPCVSQIRSIGTQLSRHHLLCGQHNVSDHPSGSGGCVSRCLWFCRVTSCDCDGLILTQKV